MRQTELKRQVASGTRTVAEIVAEEEDTGNLKVWDLLMAQKRWGRDKTRKFMFKAGLPENKELRTLTERQRRALVLYLDPPRGR